MVTASLLRRRSRMLIALLAIAIGGAILSGLVTIYYDVPRQMGAQFRNYGANMIVTANDAGFSLGDFERSKACIASSDLVGATAFRYKTVRMHEQPVQAAGTDMESIRKTSPYWSVDGDYPSGRRSLLVGKNIAENLGLSVGGRVTLSFTPEDLSALDTQLDFLVSGIVNTGGNEENYVYMSFEDLKDLTGDADIYDVAELSVTSGSDSLEGYVKKITDSVNSVTRLTRLAVTELTLSVIFFT